MILKNIATFLSCFNFNSKQLFGIILPKIKGIVKFLFDYTLKYKNELFMFHGFIWLQLSIYIYIYIYI